MLLFLHFLVKPVSATILKHDSWKILSKILLSAKEVKPNQNYSQFAKIVNNIPQFCAHGYACLALGMSVRDIRYPMLSNNAPYGVLGKLGFTKDERWKNRLCPEEGCKWTSTLFQLIAHLNNDHKFTLPVIGRLIVPIRDDKRIVPSPILKIRRSIKNFSN